MDTASLPSYELVRPRDWTCLDQTVSLIEDLSLGGRARSAA